MVGISWELTELTIVNHGQSLNCPHENGHFRDVLGSPTRAGRNRGGSSGSTGSGPTVSAGSTASAEARDLWAVEVPVEISGKSMDELV